MSGKKFEQYFEQLTGFSIKWRWHVFESFYQLPRPGILHFSFLLACRMSVKLNLVCLFSYHLPLCLLQGAELLNYRKYLEDLSSWFNKLVSTDKQWYSWFWWEVKAKVITKVKLLHYTLPSPLFLVFIKFLQQLISISFSSL